MGKSPLVPKPKPATDKVEAFGLEAICTEVGNGLTITAIAKQIGVDFGTLHNWLNADVQRSARAREARQSAARLWDETATQRIENATDPFDLAKAKELAFHYRWRASKIAPAEYGDKLAVDHSGEMAVKAIPDDRLEARLQVLIQAGIELVKLPGSGK